MLSDTMMFKAVGVAKRPENDKIYELNFAITGSGPGTIYGRIQVEPHSDRNDYNLLQAVSIQLENMMNEMLDLARLNERAWSV